MKVILGSILALYVAIHFYTKKGVDKYNNYGKQKRHYHKHLEKD